MTYCVYIIEFEREDYFEHKIGYTSNLQKRLKDYKNATLINHFKCANKFNAIMLEYALLDTFKEYAINSFREWFYLPCSLVEDLKQLDNPSSYKHSPSHYFKRGTVPRSRHMK